MLRDRVALVTGASRGIGAATARLLVARGVRVVCTGRDEGALHRVADPIGANVIVADLAELDAPERVIAVAAALHGRLDIVVANAGVGFAGPFAAMPPEEVVRLVDVNLRSTMLLARAAIPLLKAADGGALLLVGSIAGAVPVPGEAVYSATKTALETFAVCLREELRADRVAISTVLPGVVDTDFFETRGVRYDRRFPRPMPADRVAGVIVNALERGTERAVVPRWLSVADRLHGTAPRLYRLLARRFS
jgi:short-subunit dehydrogenase